MRTQDSLRFHIGHPAPSRDKVSGAALLTALFGAPVAWAIQLLANAAVSGAACVGPTGERVAEAPDVVYPVVIAVNLAAALAAAAAFVLALRSFRQTSSEAVDSHGGVMDSGEGRVRLLAIWGIWTSVLFVLAILFNTVAVFWSGLCAT